MITVPQDIEWEDYHRELDTVKDGSQVMNYRVSNIPKDLKEGDRCFVVWRGQVRGRQYIVGAVKRDKFNCTTTGKNWDPGNYIQRSGSFRTIEGGPKMKGFQGIRRYHGQQ